jgi:tellurite resistance protein TehA-like permease
MQLREVGPALPLALALGFQVWVTYRVWRSRVFERAQKVNQSKLIWLLPVLGAVMVISVLSQEERADRNGPQLRL